ncbi:leucine zipper domain-containing protein [Streptomyces sp. NPDC055400]
MLHRNAPLSPEGRRRLIDRCRNRPIAHVAAEMGISRACASKWVNRFRRHGDLGLLGRSSPPHRQPTQCCRGQPPADRLRIGVTDVLASYS